MNYEQLPKFHSGDPQIFARIDDDGLCRLTCTAEHPDFVAWLAEGNEPLSAPEPEPIPEPTAAEKLAASGLTVEELKELLGLE